MTELEACFFAWTSEGTTCVRYRVLSQKGPFLKRGQVLSLETEPYPKESYIYLLGTRIDLTRVQRVAKNKSFEVGQVFIRGLRSEEHPTQITSDRSEALNWFVRKTRFQLNRNWIPDPNDCPNPWYRNLELSARKFSILEHVQKGRLGCLVLETEGFTKRCGGIFDFAVRHSGWNFVSKLIRFGSVSTGVFMFLSDYGHQDEMYVRYTKFKESLPKPPKKPFIKKSKPLLKVKIWDDVDETCRWTAFRKLIDQTQTLPPERVLQLKSWKQSFPYLLSNYWDKPEKVSLLLPICDSKVLFKAFCWSIPSFETKPIFEELYRKLSLKHQRKYFHCYLYSLRGENPDPDVVEFMISALERDVHQIQDRSGNSLLKICSALRFKEARLQIEKAVLEFVAGQMNQR